MQFEIQLSREMLKTNSRKRILKPFKSFKITNLKKEKGRVKGDLIKNEEIKKINDSGWGSSNFHEGNSFL